MRRRAVWLSIAAVVVGLCAGALAVVSGSRAGSGPPENTTFTVFVQDVLTTAKTSYVRVKLTIASGKGTGSATNTLVTINADHALQGGSANGCSGPTLVGTVDRYTCDLGTLNAGQTAALYVPITAPSTASASGDTYDVSATGTFDNGAVKKGGGGGSMNTLSASDQTTVYPTTDKTHAGGCPVGAGSISTPPVSNEDPQSTSVNLPAASGGAPCTFGWIREDGPQGSIRTQISVLKVPQSAGVVQVTIFFYGPSVPGPFSDFSVVYLPLYTQPGDPLTSDFASCVGGQIPEGHDACQIGNVVKNGNVYVATWLLRGNVGDPGFGGG